MVGLKQRLFAAEVRQREFANRDPLTGVGNSMLQEATGRARFETLMRAADDRMLRAKRSDPRREAAFRL
jgi:GGDEF domain-containing protein